MFTGMGKNWGHGFGANTWGVGYALRTARRAAKANRARARMHRGKNIRQTDYKSEVSETAGEIYRLLAASGEIDLTDLRIKSGIHGMLFWAAIGWLSREDKVHFSLVEDCLFVGRN